MSIRVALHHKTTYQYDRPIHLGPQVVRLRPAAHTRTPVNAYSLDVAPEDHFLNWQQDPFGNYLARCVFEEKVTEFQVTVDLIATMTVVNPFDFFLEPDAVDYPFAYPAELLQDLKPYLATNQLGPKAHAFLGELDYRPRRTIDFLVDLNTALERHINYTVRMEPGVQTPEETLTKRSGSCRDSGWLLVELLRQLGFASRFVSGYLIQLTPDQKSLDGPSGPVADFTDLHAWAEVFLPGAGWIGLDPTSGLFAGEGHIPLACTPHPISAAPITGSLDECEVDFRHEMKVSRVHETPRVTLPYSDEQWDKINVLGLSIDQHLTNNDVRLTMGGEPTFVSIDDMDGDEWQTEAVGPNKLRLAADLHRKLTARFGEQGVHHHGQGKWYPGEPLPRWSMATYWRLDGQPVWEDGRWLADIEKNYGFEFEHAEKFAKVLAGQLGVSSDYCLAAKEDAMYYMWRERRLPKNVDLHDSKLESEEERTRIARIFENGLTGPVGIALPLERVWRDGQEHWHSGHWVVRSEDLFLIPGDSPMGYRLPLQSLIYEDLPEYMTSVFASDPTAPQAELPPRSQVLEALRNRQGLAADARALNVEMRLPKMQTVGTAGNGHGNGQGGHYSHGRGDEASTSEGVGGSQPASATAGDTEQLVRTALCVEPREGKLFVFLPPLSSLEAFLDLVAAIELTASELEMPIVIEGYSPPHDSRLQHFKITPDPGVIEVNIHPAKSWDELRELTFGVYEDARQARLGTEKFDKDGQHTGTGGGNHIVLGGPTPNDSPWLRRPDLLKSFLAYWHNHPSLSYLFSGRFIGPTSQAPRVDESRTDAVYELSIACQQIRNGEQTAPWLVDRVFRHLLTDVTGNTHRAEFCIDKLYSPDSATGRLGLVEFRGFEMPPHARMSLTQQLLIRGLVARFWEQPYDVEMVDWGTSLHDRFMLPHFIGEDFRDVICDLERDGFAFEHDWFAPHFEFKFPILGEFTQRSVHVELRKAVEPWYVLGEEPAGGGTARFVDSSLERLQVKVRGMTDSRHQLTCNGRALPLHPTGTQGEFVAGVRYRAWQPPHCLHPTSPVNTPLVFDLIDRWNQRSIGGCQYHVGNPTGLNPDTFPINAYEAESRRAVRFFNFGHTGGSADCPAVEFNREFPMTLDLRRSPDALC